MTLETRLVLHDNVNSFITEFIEQLPCNIVEGKMQLIPYGSGRLADLIPTILSSIYIILTAISVVDSDMGLTYKQK